MHCGQCGSTTLKPGFLSDFGQGAQGDTQWVEGPVERGVFGVAKLWRKGRWQVNAFCCAHCGHLELFVGEKRN